MAFDYGSSNVKVSAASYNGKKIKLEKIHSFKNYPVNTRNIIQWDILKLYAELLDGIKMSVNRYDEIESIGISAWGGDFALLDKDDYLIGNPLHYRNFHNKKSESLYKSLLNKISKIELFKLTGLQFASPGFNLFQLHNLNMFKKEIFLVARKLLMIPDLFNYFLTGCSFAELTINGMSQILEQSKKRWSSYIIRKINIPQEIFPKIIEPCSVIGSINNVSLNNINCSNLKVIVPVEHDTASAFSTIPFYCTGDRNQKAAISIGSWCVLGIETKNQILSQKAFEYGFSNQAGPSDNFYFFKNMTGMWPAECCRNEVSNESNKHISSWDDIVTGVIKSTGFNSFINIDNEIFSGVSKSMRTNILQYLKATNQDNIKSDSELFRCIFISLVLRFRFNVELLENVIGKTIDCLYLVGGGSRNHFICQLTANILDVQVISGIFEATSFGNIISQMKALKELDTFKDGQELINESLDFKEYYPEDTSKWTEYYNKYIEIIEKYESQNINS